MQNDLTATVHICAHYNTARIPFLVRVLRAIERWPIAQVDVFIETNDCLLAQAASIEAARQRFVARGWGFAVEIAQGLAHPFHLTWWHNRYLPVWLQSAVQDRDYFIYIEDDIVINPENLVYYIETLRKLAPLGLLPSFLRYEFDANRGKRSVDLVAKQPINRWNTLQVGDELFVVPINPYWAGSFFDRNLASEYISSLSSSMEGSAQVCDWDIRARAAMGLTFEKVPKGLQFRYVVPVIAGKPTELCKVWHCANNYTTTSGSPFARIPIDRVFLSGPLWWHVPTYLLWLLPGNLTRQFRPLLFRAMRHVQQMQLVRQLHLRLLG